MRGIDDSKHIKSAAQEQSKNVETRGGKRQTAPEMASQTFYIAQEGKDTYAVSEQDFRDMIFRGDLEPGDHYFCEGMENWTRVGDYRAKADALRPPPVPMPMARAAVTQNTIASQPQRPSSSKEPRYLTQGTAAVILACFLPGFWAPLILLSVGLIIAAFVMAIMAIVKGRALGGALLLTACLLAIVIAFVAMLAPVSASFEKAKARSEQLKSQRR